MSAVMRIIAAGVLFALAGASMASQGALGVQTQESSAAHQMRCVVKVTADIDIVPLSLDLVEALLQSDAVAGRAIHRVAGERYDATNDFFHIQPLAGERVDAAQGTQTVLFALGVHLPHGVRPAAREFGHALIEGLRGELNMAFATHVEELERQRSEAEAEQETARTEFEDAMRASLQTEAETIRPDPADQAVYGQLDRTVDLSALQPQTPAVEAFEMLRKSVNPPLRIVVLWRDLLENADIQPTSPIEMNGVRDIRLGTALENLLRALCNPLYPDFPIGSAINHGVITVGTSAGLPREAMETAPMSCRLWSALPAAPMN